jgi:DNA-binding GntR family transcriptional regulator
MSGQLQPGDVVQPGPVGHALGISTTPAREALHALRVEGFLDLIPGRGFQVAPLTGQDIRDLYCAYALLAGELTARACSIGSAGELRELEALHHELVAASHREDYLLIDEKNNAFHRQIIEMGGSRKLRWAVGLVERYLPHSFTPPIAGWLDATLRDHVEILDRLKAGDPESARAAMHEHIMRGGDLLASTFDAHKREPALLDDSEGA